jgi:cytoplasmic iron level regulating protein YaaA (DUF328/UPF0246 family)
MKILFAPSEAKSDDCDGKTFSNDSFIFPELFQKRLEVLNLYSDFLKSASKDERSKLFGSKKSEIIDYYSSDIFERCGTKVIKRYNGVAYEYLDYESLSEKSKEYIDENLIIFSNLFGPLRAGDSGLIDYKLKQGEKIDTFKVEDFYKKNFSSVLDEFLKDEDIVDLRAGFYEKFYKINQSHITMKFIKDGKVVSHWAKAYRGIVLKQMAQNRVQSIDELLNLKVENLDFIEIREIKSRREVICAIS